MNTLNMSNDEAFALLKAVSFRLLHLSFEEREEMHALKQMEMRLKEQLSPSYAHSFYLWLEREKSKSSE